MGFFGDLVGNAIRNNAGKVARMGAGYLAKKAGLGTGSVKALENIAGGLGDRGGALLGDKAAGAIKFRKGGIVLMKKMRRARGKAMKGSIAAKRKMAAVRRYKKRR
jgi:hypothetical protein